MTYIRGNKAEFDAWEKLGNPGWNWDSLFPYFKKSENYTRPSGTQLAAGATYQAQYHGFSGPLHVGYPAALHNGSFAPLILGAWESMSLRHNPDLNSGDVHGFGMGPQTLDRDEDVRWDAARAYYIPVEDRPNLRIVRGTVKRLLWRSQDKKPCGSRERDSLLIANGVEFVTSNRTLQRMETRKEVIISAGGVRTPLVLESSGIGNYRSVFHSRHSLAEIKTKHLGAWGGSRILNSLGIETLVNLPGVGENLGGQSAHIMVLSGEMESSASAYHTYVTAADLFGDRLATVKEATRNNLPEWARAMANASGGALDAQALEEQFRLQYELIFHRHVTAAEVITVSAPGGILASNYYALQPFSRGSVHLGSLDQIDRPVIDPGIFSADFDITATIAVGKITRKFWHSEHIRPLVVGQLVPDAGVLPENATDAQWHAHLRQSRMCCSYCRFSIILCCIRANR